LALEVSAVVVSALATICEIAAEVVGSYVASPLYALVIEWVATASVDVVHVAVATFVTVEVSGAAAHTEVAASRKLTVPVGVTPVPVTVEVNVTD
jgi:hypothetical protein